MNKFNLFIGGLMMAAVMSSCTHYPTEFCKNAVANDSILQVTRIAFGSCSKETTYQPILYKIADQQPDMFIYLGDNIYGDTEDMEVLRGKYALLSCSKEFQYLMASQPVFATWDDHDYGVNDGGLEYPKKEQSKQIFLEFWHEPANSNRWTHEGIYTSYEFGVPNKRVQVILLDTRTFRTALKSGGGGYVANYNGNATILGAAQWTWLEQELLKPAKIRIIGSSTQFCTEHNFWEAWANFPLEQEKMFELIRTTQANGVVFISGDVHYAEVSKRTEPNLYPIYDVTSSGLTQLEYSPAANQYRVGNAFAQRNFGMIEINWALADPEIKMMILNESGNQVYSHTVALSTLHF
jgi:alkaline phosphatase D